MKPYETWWATASDCEISMNCPRPVRSRAMSAAMIEKAACAPAFGSP